METSYDTIADDHDRFINQPGWLSFELLYLEALLARTPHAPTDSTTQPAIRASIPQRWPNASETRFIRKT